MLLIGLTGSIAMGKSTTAAAFAACGIPVFDADRAVHELYRGKAAPLVEAAFPGTTDENGVDRQRLAPIVVGNEEAIRRLEAIVHPMVAEARTAFLDATARAGHRIAVLDVPLLFEGGNEGSVDVVVVVSAPEAIQRERILSRPAMTAERMEALLARQLPDEEKRRRAHFVIDTGTSIDVARAQVEALVRSLRPIAALK